MRLDHHHLAARFSRSDDRTRDGLIGADRDQDLGVRVAVEAVVRALMPRHRLPQHRHPDAGRYWFWPSLIASTAAASIDAGPSVSGKTCPRLIAS